MGPTDPPRFEVSPLPGLRREIMKIGKRAASRGVLRQFTDALEAIVTHLEYGPLTWGDPLFHPKAPGSTVLHAMRGSLYVRYIVYEIESKVVLLTIRPVGNTPLAD